MVPRKTFICSWRCDAPRGKASQKRLQPNSFDRIGIHCREMAPTTHQSAPILARENFIVALDHRHWLEPWIENGSAANLRWQRTENQQRKDKEFPWTHSFDQNGFVKVKLARAYMFLGDDAMYRRSLVLFISYLYSHLYSLMSTLYGAFLSHGGTRSYHPFL